MRYKSKFEIKRDVWVYIPDDSLSIFGKKLHVDIISRWSIPVFFYHFKNGGHLSAIKSHLNHRYFSKLDIKNFFANVSRSKILRGLKSIGYDWKEALDIATISTVKYDHRRGLPFGFPQSTIIASLVLEKSYLGQKIWEIANRADVKISVYVDDIVISSDDRFVLEKVTNDIDIASRKSALEINKEKLIVSSLSISVFNIDISYGSLKISDSKIEEFISKFKYYNDSQKSAVLSYIASVNDKQFMEMKKYL